MARRYLGAVALPLLIALRAGSASAHVPTRVEYKLTVDNADPSGITVEVRITKAPADFRLAMATHAEYDDRYWRYVTDLRGTSARGPVTVTREDNSLWRVIGPKGDVTIRYHVGFPLSPPMQQASWKAHLTPTGGLVGGPHSFLYVVGSERTPVRLTLALPIGWNVATGLARGPVEGEFLAPGAEALLDSPMLVGRFRSWKFEVDGVPHRVAYLDHPGGTPFDSGVFVANVERITRETVHLFGRMPYQEYQFLFEDGTFGGLEHLNSVSIGTQSSNLARDPNILLGQIAHEFFHTWNEVHLRPVSWIGIRHVTPAPTGELWWSEGVTIYFADLMLRRADFPRPDATRVQHLETLISAYVANPSHGMVSAEQTSRAFNLLGATGDYTPNMFSQGELLGDMLDLMIRDASGSRRSLDDVMRSLLRRFTPDHGFTGRDVERAVSEACACNALPFFDKYVRKATPLDFDRWLGVVGLRTVVTWETAVAPDGAPLADLRVSGFVPPGEFQARLQVWFPATVWGRAGLHTGDRLVSWNGAPIHDVQQLRTAVSEMHIGDSARVMVQRDSGKFEADVTVPGYQRPTVHLEERPDATDAQRALRTRWLAGR